MEANLLEDAALLKLAWVCLCALAALAFHQRNCGRCLEPMCQMRGGSRFAEGDKG